MDEKTNLKGYISIVVSWVIVAIVYVQVTGMAFHFFTINTVNQALIFLILSEWTDALVGAGIVLLLAVLIKKVLNKLFKLDINITLKSYIFAFVITYLGIMVLVLFYDQSVLMNSVC